MEAVVAGIEAFAVIVAAMIAAAAQWRSSKLKKSLDEAQDTLSRTEDYAVGKEVELRMQRWEVQDELRSMTQDIRMSTPIDRILGFQAINGLYKPERTTMVYSDVEPEYKHLLGKYQWFPIDSTYHEKLVTAEQQGHVYVDVAHLPPHDQMKGIYMAEKVRHAIWMQVGRYDMGSGRWLVVYFSFATHEDVRLNEPATLLKLQSFIARVSQVMDKDMMVELPSNAP